MWKGKTFGLLNYSRKDKQSDLFWADFINLSKKYYDELIRLAISR